MSMLPAPSTGFSFRKGLVFDSKVQAKISGGRMGLRFRKSFKLAPGVRLNVGNSGMSWTLGPPGASVSIGQRGTYFNASLKGTGLSARIPLDRPRAVAHAASTPTQPMKVSLSLQVGDDGIVRYLDQNGVPVDPDLIRLARQQHSDTIRGLLERKCAEINADIAALGQLHWDTPAPARPAPFVPESFDALPPSAPVPMVLGLADRLLPGRHRAAKAEGARREEEYQRALAHHERKKAAHVARTTVERMRYSAAIAGNPEPMQELLERRLAEIVWPKETLVEIEVADSGSALTLDVDLPEIEHMPSKRVALSTHSWNLSLRDAGVVATRKLYQQHVHALGFRIIGEAFAALPTVRTIVFSAYSQRTDCSNGHVNDDYLYSVRVGREEWSTLHFDALDKVDPCEALARFEIARNMTATGIFRPVQPLAL